MTVTAVAEVVAAAAAVGAAVGLDNMRASAAIAVAAPRRARRRWLVALLVADALALVVGAAIGAALPPAVSGAAAIVGVVVLATLAGHAFMHDGDPASRFEQRRLAVGVSLLLSLDNVAAGAALVAVGYPPIPTVAVAASVAAVLCLAGFVAGSVISRFAWRPLSQVAGILFSAAAVVSLLEING